MSEDKKALVQRGWEEVVNERNLDAIEEVYAPDFVWHEPDQDIHGYEQAKQFAISFFDAFPDLNITVDDLIAEGEQVVSRYTIRGTHQGETEDFGPHRETDTARRHHHTPLRRRQDSRGVGTLR